MTTLARYLQSEWAIIFAIAAGCFLAVMVLIFMLFAWVILPWKEKGEEKGKEKKKATVKEKETKKEEPKKKRVYPTMGSLLGTALVATVIVFAWHVIYRFHQTPPFPPFKPLVVVREGYVISFSTETGNSPKNLTFPTPVEDEYGARVSLEGELVCIRWDSSWEPRNEGAYDYKGSACLAPGGNGLYFGNFEGDRVDVYPSGKHEGRLQLMCSVDNETHLPHDCFSGWTKVGGKYSAVTMKRVQDGVVHRVNIQGLHGRRSGE